MVAILLLLYLFSKVDWFIFLKSIENIDIFLIIIPALMAYISIYVSILKWDIFLKNYDFVVNKLKLYSVYLIGSFFNNFFPTSIGGDIYRVINIAKKYNNKKEIVSSIILERGFGFLTLFIINFLLAGVFGGYIIGNKNLLLLEILIFSFFIFIILFFLKYPLFLKFKNKIIKRDLPILNKFHDLMVSVTNIKSKKDIFYGIFYSVIFSIIVALAMYILFYAFGLHVNFYYILFVSSITQIIGILPISLNSIGVTEGLNVFLFSLIGVPLEISLSVALIGRISQIITSSIGGIFYFFDSNIKH
jgi:uncharacterized protein (TIRG00374 family)